MDEKITMLQKQIAMLVEYMQNKIVLRDWHAVADAAMDIRELEAKIKVYEEDRIWIISSSSGVEFK